MGRFATYVLPALLALLLAGLVLALLSAPGTAQTPGARKARKPAAAKATPQAGTPKAAKDEDEEQGESLTPAQVLQRLMQRPEAVQGRTLRGLTIAQAPPFKATTRIEHLTYYPCSDCHEDQDPNPKPRVLKDEHVDLDFQHGGGRFWCYDACHNPKDMDHLVSLHGEPISYDEAYKLCGQCHFQRQKDWFFGGHGKRAGTFPVPRDVPLVASKIDFSNRGKIGTWRGERVLTICTDCHDAHSPSIKPYKPSPPPEVRRGLSRKEDRGGAYVPIWTELKLEGGAPR
jgi:hypothetical protein